MAQPGKMAKRAVAAILAAVAAALLALYLASGPPEISRSAVFTANAVVTMDDDGSVHEAIWVRDGRIEAVGSRDEILARAGGDAELVDFGNAAIVPGLIEPHTHPIASALLGAVVDVSGFTHDSRASVIETLENAAAGFSLTPWIIAYGWDPLIIADLDPPTLEELDRISPDKPLVVLTQMMHDAYANSAALAAAGINESTPDPRGGQFVRDASGRLTGTVREVPAIRVLLDASPPPPEGTAELLLSLQYAKYARAGYTTVGVLGPVGNVADPIGVLANVGGDPNAPLRTVVYGLPEQLEAQDLAPGPLRGRVTLRGVKFWMDGSPFAGGAAWSEPYENSELVLERLHLERDHLPDLNYAAERFYAEYERWHAAGFQIAVHVHGERAIDRVLEAAERAMQSSPRKDARHRLEHNALIDAGQLERASRLGLTPSFFIDHVYFYGHRLPELVGDDRTKRYMPVATAVGIGHRATLHSDNPATPIDPLRVLQTAVRRLPRGGGSRVAASERLTNAQALRAMTIDAAWQLGLEDVTGSLVPGKLADMTVLSANPLTAEPADIGEIKAISTWLAGKPSDARTWRRAHLSRAIDILGRLLTR